MTHAYVSLAQVMKRVELRPMPMGLHPKHAPQGQRQPLKQVAIDGDETVPLINGGLAAKAMKGRQSIAQVQTRQVQTRPQPKVSLQIPPALSMPDALVCWVTSRSQWKTCIDSSAPLEMCHECLGLDHAGECCPLRGANSSAA